MPDLTARIAATLLPHFHYPDDDANWDAAVHAAEAVVRMLETEGKHWWTTDSRIVAQEEKGAWRVNLIRCPPLEPSPPGRQTNMTEYRAMAFCIVFLIGVGMGLLIGGVS